MTNVFLETIHERYPLHIHTHITYDILTKEGKVMLSGYLLITGVMSVSCGTLRGTRGIL